MTTPHSIDWIDGQPYSHIFGDVFFSRESGLEETRHVFLKGNNLPGRWPSLRSGESFVIGETGFGTGLNFLASWQLWKQLVPKGHLHFLSVEQFPLSSDVLRLTHAAWPELSEMSDLLLAQYGALSTGWHRLVFEKARITLTLVLGDARLTLPRVKGYVHAWFLDGFAPARNPEIWEESVLRQVARLSHPNSTLSTYTCAGAVRRTLQSVGFSVRKIPGFGRKREMVIGDRQSDKDASTSKHSAQSNKVIVLGGGIAGCSVSRSLARRGWNVTLIERQSALGYAASGIPQAILHVRLPNRMHAAHEITLLGYQHTLRLCNELLADSPMSWQPCGALQLAHASRRLIDLDRLGSLSLPSELISRVTQQEASDTCGFSLPSHGLYFPRSGWLHGPELCHKLAAHTLIAPRLDALITDVYWSKEERHWIIKRQDGRLDSTAIMVIANAMDAAQFSVARHLPLHRVGGQITLIPSTINSRALRTILCGEGVVTPDRVGYHSVGATFNHSRQDEEPSGEEHEINLRMLSTLAPSVAEAMQVKQLVPSELGSKVAFRCTSPDRAPLAGALSSAQRNESGREGLFLSVAHGSRGFATGPLCGELIASEIVGEPAPLPIELLEALSPQRFALSKT